MYLQRAKYERLVGRVEAPDACMQPEDDLVLHVVVIILKRHTDVGNFLAGSSFDARNSAEAQLDFAHRAGEKAVPRPGGVDIEDGSDL